MTDQQPPTTDRIAQLNDLIATGRAAVLGSNVATPPAGGEVNVGGFSTPGTRDGIHRGGGGDPSGDGSTIAEVDETSARAD
eukprot:scaffold2314_cov55-Cyclotella_meneghiniana.AAC.1